MFRKITFALVAAAALGAAALAPTSAFARGGPGGGSPGGFHGGGHHAGWSHRGTATADGAIGATATAVGGRGGAITIRVAAGNSANKAGPLWPGRWFRGRRVRVADVAGCTDDK